MPLETPRLRGLTLRHPTTPTRWDANSPIGHRRAAQRRPKTTKTAAGSLPVTELANDTLLRALLREPVDYTPVWMMRQAGRYLKEYRETRAKAGSFMDLCRNPELACEVTIQPLERFPLDAAILFSDILTVPDAMGLGLSFAEGEGPQFEHPVRTEADVARIRVPDPEDELRYVMDAVRVIRRELDGRVPLIGFSGSPWTLATYMIEGGTTKQFALSKSMMFDRPDLMHALLAKVADAVTLYLNAQIAAGAQVAMVFDTWGGVLSPGDYRDFSLRYMERIVDGLTREADGRRVPVVLFTKGGGQWLDRMAETGCDALGVDWTTELSDARRMVGDKVALQGNLDPCTLYASPERIRREVGRVLASYGAGSGHVFNLGHGIHPDTNPEHAGAMVAAVHELSRPYHASA
jgi:uroporphyrinogen decarboxylase